MAEVETIYLELRAKLDQLDADLRSAEGRAQQAGERTGAGFGSSFVRGADGRLRDLDTGRYISEPQARGAGERAGRAAGEGFKGAFSAAADLTKVMLGVGAGLLAAAGGAVKLAGDAEQAQVAFTTLLGSGQKARSFLAELSQFAARTPFELPGLQNSSRKLLAFGFTAQQIIPMMTAIGDAVGALGGGAPEIDRVTLALGQMQAKGKVSAEEMNQLAELGIPAWDMLAKAIGISIPEAMQRAQNGAISASEAIPGILQGMEDRFAGSMDTQSQTLLGLWSTVTDTARQTLTGLGQFLVEEFNLKGVVAQLGDGLGRIQALLKGGGLKELLQQYQPVIVTVAGAIMGVLVPGLYSMAAAGIAAVAPLLPFIAAGAAIALAMHAAGVSFTDVANAIRGAVSWVQSLAVGLNEQYGITQRLQPVIQALGGVFSAVFGAIRALWDGVLKPVFEAIAPIVARAFSLILPILTTALNVIKSVFNTFAALFRGDWQGFWDGILDILKGLGRLLLQAGEAVFGTLVTALDTIWPKVKDGLQTLLNRILRGLATWDVQLAKAAMGLLEGLLKKLQDMLPDWFGLGKSLVDQLIKGLESGQDAADKALGKLKPGGTEGVNGLGGTGFDSSKRESVQRAAQRLGVNPNDLAAVISFETAGTFSPNARNPDSSATGLIQFMAGTGGTAGAYYGMTRDQFGGLSFDQQMEYVIRYLEGRGIGKNGKSDLASIYNAVLGSGYRRGTPEYEKNARLNANNNGVIEPGEAVRSAQFTPHVKNYFDSGSQGGTGSGGGSPFGADAGGAGAGAATGKGINIKGLFGGGGSGAPTPDAALKALQDRLKGVQDQFVLGQLSASKYAAQLRQLGADAKTAGLKSTGDVRSGYAQLYQQTQGALDGLSKGATKELKAQKDELTELQARYEFVGKSGLPAYIQGLNQFIATQTRAASSAKAGSEAQLIAMQNVNRARQMLDTAKKGGPLTDEEKGRKSIAEEIAAKKREAALRAASPAQLDSKERAAQAAGDLALYDAIGKERDRRKQAAKQAAKQADQDRVKSLREYEQASQKVASSVGQMTDAQLRQTAVEAAATRNTTILSAVQEEVYKRAMARAQNNGALNVDVLRSQASVSAQAASDLQADLDAQLKAAGENAQQRLQLVQELGPKIVAAQQQANADTLAADLAAEQARYEGQLAEVKKGNLNAEAVEVLHRQNLATIRAKAAAADLSAQNGYDAELADARKANLAELSKALEEGAQADVDAALKRLDTLTGAERKQAREGLEAQLAKYQARGDAGAAAVARIMTALDKLSDVEEKAGAKLDELLSGSDSDLGASLSGKLASIGKPEDAASAGAKAAQPFSDFVAGVQKQIDVLDEAYGRIDPDRLTPAQEAAYQSRRTLLQGIVTDGNSAADAARKAAEALFAQKKADTDAGVTRDVAAAGYVASSLQPGGPSDADRAAYAQALQDYRDYWAERVRVLKGEGGPEYLAALKNLNAAAKEVQDNADTEALRPYTERRELTAALAARQEATDADRAAYAQSLSDLRGYWEQRVAVLKEQGGPAYIAALQQLNAAVKAEQDNADAERLRPVVAARDLAAARYQQAQQQPGGASEADRAAYAQSLTDYRDYWAARVAILENEGGPAYLAALQNLNGAAKALQDNADAESLAAATDAAARAGLGVSQVELRWSQVRVQQGRLTIAQQVQQIAEMGTARRAQAQADYQRELVAAGTNATAREAAEVKLQQALLQIDADGAAARHDLLMSTLDSIAQWADAAAQIVSRFSGGTENAFTKVAGAVSSGAKAFAAFSSGDIVGGILGVVDAIEQLANAILMLDPGFQKWIANLKEVADMENRAAGAGSIGGGLIENPYSKTLKSDAGNRTALAGAGPLQRFWWWLTGTAPAVLDDGKAILLSKASTIFEDLGNGLIDVLQSSLMDAFNTGDFSSMEKALDKFINNFIARTVLQLIIAKSSLQKFIKKYSDDFAAATSPDGPGGADITPDEQAGLDQDIADIRGEGVAIGNSWRAVAPTLPGFGAEKKEDKPDKTASPSTTISTGSISVPTPTIQLDMLATFAGRFDLSLTKLDGIVDKFGGHVDRMGEFFKPPTQFAAARPRGT